MAVDVIMPQMGESIFEGTITKWLKKPGDKIERDEPLFEISTDKVDAEIPSPSAGVLKEIKVIEGQTVPIQTVVAVIDAAGAGAAAQTSPAASATKADAKAASAPVLQETPESRASAKSTASPPRAVAASTTAGAPAKSSPTPAAGTAPQSKGEDDGDDVRSSPLVRRIARENSIDLAQVTGTGAGGRVSKQDILAVVEAGTSRIGAATASAASPSTAPSRPSGPPPASAPAAGAKTASAVLETAVPREKLYFGHYEVQPMSPMRQRIAEHMVLSKRVSPHVDRKS